jgi:LysM repeat protein
MRTAAIASKGPLRNFMQLAFDIALETTNNHFEPARIIHTPPMKIIKILGIAAGLHALALLLIFANPGCSYTKAATPDSTPISDAPAATGAGASSGATDSTPDSMVIRYSPTRPGTTVATALAAQPVSDVTPATTYTVVRGDSLSAIAKKNQLTKSQLSAANGLKTGSVLRVGQKLIIPAKAAPAPGPAPAAGKAAMPPAAAAPTDRPAADVVKHVVKQGETLGAIARKYGVRQGEIAVANNITDPRKIQPGQELVIPARSTPVGARQSKAAKSKPDASDVAGGAPAGADTKAASPPATSDTDLDAGLKPSGAVDVPVVKIEDGSQGAPPKTP